MTLLVASLLLFAATQMLPGDPASVVLGRGASPDAVAELDHKLGLDGSLPAQYADWISGVASGDLGDSAAALAQGADEAPIWDIMREPLLNTAILAGLTTLLMVPLALILGVYAGLRAGRRSDHVVSVASLALASLPEFALAALLVLVFFNLLDVLPSVALIPPGETPLTQPDKLVLPILTLLLITGSWGMRQVRAGVIEQLEKPYVTAARLNGIPEPRIKRAYVVRNSLATSVQVLTQNVQYLIGGIIIVEAVFAYPGLGKFLVDAVTARDFREVEAVGLIIAATYIVLNIVADLLVMLLVPRLRTEPK